MRKTLIVMLASVLPIVLLAVETAYWDPNGSGPWAEGAPKKDTARSWKSASH